MSRPPNNVSFGALERNVHDASPYYALGADEMPSQSSLANLASDHEDDQLNALLSSPHLNLKKEPESIDFAEPVSLAYKEHLVARRKEPRSAIWFFVLGTAILTALFSILLVSVLHQVQHLKYYMLRAGLSRFNREELTRTDDRDYGLGFLMWILMSVVCAVSASLVGKFVPDSVGGGSPEVLAMLNGVHSDSIYAPRTLIAKFFSTILSVGSGLPIGYYGPIIHGGAMIGATLLSRMKLFRCGFVTYFRNPRDQRIITIVGAAVGVTGAFGVPLGGLIFVMEMLATAFPLRLAFYVFTSCLTCSFLIQVFFSYFKSFGLRDRTGLEAGQLMPGAMILFDTRILGTSDVPMNFFSFIPSIILGILGGLLGAAYIKLSVKAVNFRRSISKRAPLFRTLESSITSVIYAALVYWIAIGALGTTVKPPSRLFSPGCNAVPLEWIMQEGNSTVNYYGIQGDICQLTLTNGSVPTPEEINKEYFHPFASLTFGFADNAAQMLLSWNTKRDMGLVTLTVFLVLYFVFSAITTGARISGDILLPCVVMGAAMGRIVGMGARSLAILAASGKVEEVSWADPGVFALIGAGSFLAGTTRLTFSIAVILIELTNDFRHVGCVMVAISLAKAIGDKLTKSSATTFLDLNGVPLMDFLDKAGKYDIFTAGDVMSQKVVSAETVETVARLCHFLRKTTHNGFPVVSVDGSVKGLITRHQLKLLLWRTFLQKDNTEANYNDLRGMEDTLYDLNIADKIPTFGIEWAEVRVNLNNHIDTSAYRISERTALSRMYYLFQTMGMRHLIVTTSENRLAGIITRKDLLSSFIMKRILTENQRRIHSTVDRGEKLTAANLHQTAGLNATQSGSMGADSSMPRNNTGYFSEAAEFGSDILTTPDETQWVVDNDAWCQSPKSSNLMHDEPVCRGDSKTKRSKPPQLRRDSPNMRRQFSSPSGSSPLVATPTSPTDRLTTAGGKRRPMLVPSGPTGGEGSSMGSEMMGSRQQSSDSSSSPPPPHKGLQRIINYKPMAADDSDEETPTPTRHVTPASSAPASTRPDPESSPLAPQELEDRTEAK